jgi:hypothetical protein
MDNDKPRSGSSSDATGGGHDHVADRRKAAPAPQLAKMMAKQKQILEVVDGERAGASAGRFGGMVRGGRSGLAAR